LLVALCSVASSLVHAQDPNKDARPALALKATPSVSFSPAKVTLRAELRGGQNDFETYYCAGVEWDWDDGTKSENSYDCEPFEAGKSEIRRVFTVQHTYEQSGTYRVHFRLKQGNKVVAQVNSQVQVRPGLREGLIP
jgi:hypothetical protein